MTRDERQKRDERIAALVVDGQSLADICGSEDVSTETVREVCHQRAVKFPSPRPTLASLVSQVENGKTPEEVASASGVNLESLRHACRAKGVLPPKIPGTDCCAARIIAALFDASKTVAQIAVACRSSPLRVYQLYHQAVECGVPGLPPRGRKKKQPC